MSSLFINSADDESNESNEFDQDDNSQEYPSDEDDDSQDYSFDESDDDDFIPVNFDNNQNGRSPGNLFYDEDELDGDNWDNSELDQDEDQIDNDTELEDQLEEDDDDWDSSELDQDEEKPTQMECTLKENTIALPNCSQMKEHIKGDRSEGGFGTVYVTNEYAIKVMQKEKPDLLESEESSSDFSEQERVTRQDLQQEINAIKMAHQKCPNYVAGYYGFYEDSDNYYLITQPIKNGYDLKKMWLRLKDKMPERAFEALVNQLVLGLLCIHGSGVAHNDIKLENIMYNMDTNSFVYIDFGMACLNGVCPIVAQSGTEYYLPPESLYSPLKDMTLPDSFKRDYWSLGILILMFALWDNPEYLNLESTKTYAMLDFRRRALKESNETEMIDKYNDVLTNNTTDLIAAAVKNYPNVKIQSLGISLGQLLTNLLQLDTNKRKII